MKNDIYFNKKVDFNARMLHFIQKHYYLLSFMLKKQN